MTNITNPNDPKWMAFVEWAQRRWDKEAWHHTINTCGEWDAWNGALEQQAAQDAINRSNIDRLAGIVNQQADEIEQQAAQIAEKDAEIARLTECLSKANANHEHFERAWYLRGDEVEALRADAERLRALATCGCGDGFTAHDPGTCGNCMAAIDAALRQEGPKP